MSISSKLLLTLALATLIFTGCANKKVHTALAPIQDECSTCHATLTLNVKKAHHDYGTPWEKTQI